MQFDFDNEIKMNTTIKPRAFLLGFEKLSSEEKALSDFCIANFRKEVMETVGDMLTPKQIKKMDKRLAKTEILFSDIKNAGGSKAFPPTCRVLIGVGTDPFEAVSGNFKARNLKAYIGEINHEIFHILDLPYFRRIGAVLREGRAKAAEDLLSQKFGRPFREAYGDWTNMIKQSAILNNLPKEEVLLSFFDFNSFKRNNRFGLFNYYLRRKKTIIEKINEKYVSIKPNLIAQNEIIQEAKALLVEIHDGKEISEYIQKRFNRKADKLLLEREGLRKGLGGELYEAIDIQLPRWDSGNKRFDKEPTVEGLVKAQKMAEKVQRFATQETQSVALQSWHEGIIDRISRVYGRMQTGCTGFHAPSIRLQLQVEQNSEPIIGDTASINKIII